MFSVFFFIFSEGIVFVGPLERRLECTITATLGSDYREYLVKKQTGFRKSMVWVEVGEMENVLS